MFASLALEPPAFCASTSLPARRAIAVPESSSPDLPRNARRAMSGEEYEKKLIAVFLCVVGNGTLDARDVRLRSRLDRIQHVVHDAIAARTVEPECVLQAAVDVARERFA